MLRLENIVKNYKVADQEVSALKGLSLNFRQNEFVSILGPSGCGKTTLLNIIGGLDRYTSGDLVIAGKSTVSYTDKDWDSYRNHTIGFVFQTYNLIMHLNVLDNVEMSLTLAGLSREERKRRATEALISVGLGDHLHKKPNQLSGGQMQRVAIARAIVNNPKIILADEPTGALDTETSIQIMEILKELAKDKLIIMVTHNPELAVKYSSRIVKVLDGKIIEDTKPFATDDEIKEIAQNLHIDSDGKIVEEENADEGKVINAKTKKKRKKAEHTSMSFFTALKLSLQNLRTKKARTILTSIAGSIGIIGVALILAMSNGFQTYVDKMQMDTLSNYPLQIEREATDLNSLMDAFGQASDSKDHTLDKVYINKIWEQMQSSKKENKIDENYIQNVVETINKDLLYGIQYKKRINLDVRAEQFPGVYTPIVSQLGKDMMSYNLLDEMIDNPEFVSMQYELVAGRYPQNPTGNLLDAQTHEMVLILDKNNEIMDIVAKMLGFNSTADHIEYEDIFNKTFKLVLNNDKYILNGEGTKFIDAPSLVTNIEDITTLKIVGIFKLNDNSSMGSISSTLAYLPSLTEYVLQKEAQSEIVLWQKQHPTINCLNGELLESQFNDKTYAEIMTKINGENIVDKINIYPKDFKSKELVKEHLNAYNATMTNENDKVYYTDLMEIMVSTVNTVISAISYILIAFTSVSLVVSSLMIGIITYVSVLERTKEIGILRSIGARRKDISRVFNAETLIIGFCAGIIGVGFTLLVSIPINIILASLIDIQGICALPVFSAVALVLISMLLTLVAGLIPASIASKKDPVLALRSE